MRCSSVKLLVCLVCVNASDQGMPFIVVMDVPDDECEDEEGSQEPEKLDKEKMDDNLQQNAEVIKAHLESIWVHVCVREMSLCPTCLYPLPPLVRTMAVMEMNNKGVWPVHILEKTMRQFLGQEVPEAHSMSLQLKGCCQHVIRMTKKSRTSKRTWMQPLKDLALCSSSACCVL